MQDYDKDINDLIYKRKKSTEQANRTIEFGVGFVGFACGLLCLNLLFNMGADPEKYETLSEELDNGTLVVPRSFYISSDLTTCVRDKVWSNVEGKDPQYVNMSDEQAEDLLEQFPGHFAHCVGGELPPTQEIKENYVNQYAEDRSLDYAAVAMGLGGLGIMFSGGAGGLINSSATKRTIKEKQDMKNLFK
jgi:hypothetical protein